MDSRALELTNIVATEILDCRGLPTLRVGVEFDHQYAAKADVPSGRSTGTYEATEIRDGGRRYGGYGVRRALSSIEGEIRASLVGERFTDQSDLDNRLIELDGTAEKGRLGANAIVGVSLAALRARAAIGSTALYQSLDADADTLPVPLINLINGGLHASNELDFQEFMIIPTGASTFGEAMEIACEVNLALASGLLRDFGKVALNVGDEGGFAPPISDPVQALEYLHEAVEKAGYTDKCVYGLDCASSHLFDPESKSYRLNGQRYGKDELLALYLRLVKEYGVRSIEDPFHEDDFEGFGLAAKELGIQIVGDDLFVTQQDRVERGIEMSSTGALLVKVNQVGTFTEALRAVESARRASYSIVVSERSGETEDPLIADLAVGLSAGYIKTGAPVRGERTAKYNRLLEIESDLGTRAEYASPMQDGKAS